jgi:transposase InsO family protein
MEASSGHRVAAVRTDNGGELLGRDLKAFFAACGVQHELSAPYTPQQNGKAERLNRTSEDRVRALLADAALPLRLWREAVLAWGFLARSQAAWRQSHPLPLGLHRQA